MKRSELEIAIRYVLGEEPYGALVKSEIALSELVKIASLKAFQKGWSYSTDTAGFLQKALEMLESPGWFNFEEE